MAKMGSGRYIVLLCIAALVIMLTAGLILYSGSGKIPPNFTIYSSTYGPTTTVLSCTYGYICGIKADGCAVPGAIYNCPNEPVSPTNNNNSGNGTIVVNLTQELQNAAKAGFAVNQSMFYSTSSAGCAKGLISACNNNVPNQFICLNNQSAEAVSSQYNNVYSASTACPQFLLAGTVSCGITNNYCVVTSSKST